MKTDNKTNWFEKNPKKTFSCLLIIFILVSGYATEKILAHRNKGVGFNYALPNRAIRLREYRPTMTEYFAAGKKEQYYDSLVKKNYLLRIDKNGFIMPSKKYENPDISLAFLGASTTECRYVDEEHRFPFLSGALLEKELGLKINSYNAARSGNHSLHSLDVFLNKVLPVKPQIVVMMHNINDLVILLYEKSYWNKNSSRSIIIDINKEILSNCIKTLRDRYIPNLAAAMRNFSYNVRSFFRGKQSSGPSSTGDEFAGARGKKLVIDKAELADQFEMNLQTFIFCCQARKITPVLMTMASRLKPVPDKVIADSFKQQERVGIKYQQFRELFDMFNDSIRKKARENGVMLIDLANEIPQEKDSMYDVVHYTEKGSMRVAEIVAANLKAVVAQNLKKQ